MASTIKYITIDDRAYIMLDGLLCNNSKSSVSRLRTTLKLIHSRGIKKFYFDLSEVTSIDSTFMGAIVEMYNILEEKGCGTVVIPNVASLPFKQMQHLGLNFLFPINEGKKYLPPEMPFAEVSMKSSENDVNLFDIVQCHKALVQKNPSLMDVFGTFLDSIDCNCSIS